jgi:drug/metabolite transporter (DMT)-like permease
MKWILLAVVVLTTVLADLLQSYEMKRVGAQDGHAVRFWRMPELIAKRGFLILAIACMAVSFFAFLALVQREALSFAVPASAASFILETILARTLLKEHLDKKRMIGAGLVLCGIILVAR